MLENPSSIGDGDQSSIALFRQTFPYFVPARYMLALESHKKAAYSPAMLSSIQPYLGNWLLFCDFIEDGSKAATTRKDNLTPGVWQTNDLSSQPLPVANKIVDKKNVEVHPPKTEAEPIEVPKFVSEISTIREEAIKAAQPLVTSNFKEQNVRKAFTDIGIERREDSAVTPAAPVSNIPPAAEVPPVEVVAETIIPQEIPAVVTEPVAAVAEVMAKVPVAPIPEAIATVEETVTEVPTVIAAEPATEQPAAVVEEVAAIIPADPVIEEQVAVAETPFVQPVQENAAPIVAEQPEAVVFAPPVAVPESVAEVTEVETLMEEAAPVMETVVPQPEAIQETIPVEEVAVPEVAAEVIPAVAEAVTPQPEAITVPEMEIPQPEAILVATPAVEAAVVEPEAVQEIEAIEAEQVTEAPNEQLIFPIYTQDYFLQQGEKVPEEIPDEIEELKIEPADDDEDKSLMVMMSFSEWLLHFKNTTEKQVEEKKDQRALKTMWQKEKLAAAMEEENEEIPENVFEMAVNSISKEEGLVSESLADVYVKQGKYDKAIETYNRLSLQNPKKNAYFARKIEEVLKEKQS